MNKTIFPWQIPLWQTLCTAKNNQRLPHALLILGADGLGEKQFVQALAQAVLCPEADNVGNPCHNCHACHLLAAHSHPDFLEIAAEEPGQIIKVDQIRDVVHFVNSTTMQNGFRVIVIHRAHSMNHHAANSLLKILEEPTPNTLFILLSNPEEHLQPTIKSRCQIFILPKPEQPVALQWLQNQSDESHEKLITALHLADGAPLKALAMLTDETLALRQTIYQGLTDLIDKKADPLQLAAQWHEGDLAYFFVLLLTWLQDLLRLQLAEGSGIKNYDFKDSLAQLQQLITKEKLLAYLTHIQFIYAKIKNSLNLNRQLLLEEVLIRWALLNDRYAG